MVFVFACVCGTNENKTERLDQGRQGLWGRATGWSGHCCFPIKTQKKTQTGAQLPRTMPRSAALLAGMAVLALAGVAVAPPPPPPGSPQNPIPHSFGPSETLDLAVTAWTATGPTVGSLLPLPKPVKTDEEVRVGMGYKVGLDSRGLRPQGG